MSSRKGRPLKITSPWKEPNLEFKLRTGEFIKLQALLKAAGLFDSGGAAKVAVVSGLVKVDGVVETQRGKKIRPGQVVTFDGNDVKVIA
jgi:ribosome-associated protein